MENNDITPQAIMITVNARSLAPGTSICPAKAESPAPPKSIIAPPSPEAVPAKCARTDNIPAVAFGIVIPLPIPTMVIEPKNAAAEAWPASDIGKEIAAPSVVMMAPNNTIRFAPSRAE